ncbi:MAG: hypothetical protein LUH03_09875 [Oscillospiraceae bacterium]|nr:hypothetical protein [Oscillospiraceae bacterium]
MNQETVIITLQIDTNIPLSEIKEGMAMYLERYGIVRNIDIQKRKKPTMEQTRLGGV